MSTPMSEKEIKDNAPDGATHYEINANDEFDIDYYIVISSHVEKIWTGEKWRVCIWDWDHQLASGVIKPL